MRNAILFFLFCLAMAILSHRDCPAWLRATACIVEMAIFAWYFSQTLTHEGDPVFIERDDETTDI